MDPKAFSVQVIKPSKGIKKAKIKVVAIENMFVSNSQPRLTLQLRNITTILGPKGGTLRLRNSDGIVFEETRRTKITLAPAQDPL